MTELIVDAIEYVKNPYKGKKLKVRYKEVLIFNVLFFFFLICHALAWCVMSTKRLFSYCLCMIYLCFRHIQTSRRSPSLPIFASLWRSEPSMQKSIQRWATWISPRFCPKNIKSFLKRKRLVFLGIWHETLLGSFTCPSVCDMYTLNFKIVFCLRVSNMNGAHWG